MDSQDEVHEPSILALPHGREPLRSEHKMPGETKYACYAPGLQQQATAAIEQFFERVLEAERLIRERSLLASDSEKGGAPGRIAS